MAPKRATRASSIAGSAVSSLPGAATPRRSTRRAGSATPTPLPPVTSRESTSYGSSTAVVPLILNRDAQNVPLEEQLARIVAPARDNFQSQANPGLGSPAPAGRGASLAKPPAVINGGGAGPNTPRAGRGGRGGSSVVTRPEEYSNFGDASSLAGDAEIGDDSAIGLRSSRSERPIRNANINGERNMFAPIVEEAEQPGHQQDLRGNARSIDEPFPESIAHQWDEVRQIAHERREAHRRAAVPWWNNAPIWYQNMSDFVRQRLRVRGFDVLRKLPIIISRWIFNHPWMLFFLVLLATTTQFFRSDTFKAFDAGQHARSYGIFDVKHNIGQFIPHYIAHPIKYFNEHDVLDLQKRMSSVEYDVQWLKHRNELSQTSIEYLERILPDFLMFKKDSSGQKIIPPDFWNALRRKINEESDTFWPKSGNPAISDGQASGKHDDRITGGAWAEFLDRNEAKIKAWQGESFDNMWNDHIRMAMKDGILVSKKDMVDTVSQRFLDSQAEIKNELRRMDAQAQRAIDMARLTSKKMEHFSDDQNAISITNEQAMTVLRSEAKRVVSAAYLEALARAQVNSGVRQNHRRVNHFSPGVGAVVNPGLTSMAFAYHKARAWLPRRTWLWMTGNPIPSPRPAIEALTKWDEPGDCWCAATNGDRAHGVQLAVMLAHNIYPDEVVVEHIPSTATLDPLAAPRRMEVLAQIKAPWDTWSTVEALSERLFPSVAPERDLDETWIRLAIFEYDNSVPHYNVQAFEIPMNLKSMGASTRQVIVRALDNWSAESSVAEDEVDHTCFYRIRLHGEIAS
ncbi:MAG: hypothetical protein M1818_006165 [Claussenomyces sp. TS43310]|nr:MAG: hypothetical protein M1818_006165 [Claussenomyces sp. TS43310]